MSDTIKTETGEPFRPFGHRLRRFIARGLWQRSLETWAFLRSNAFSHRIKTAKTVGPQAFPLTPAEANVAMPLWQAAAALRIGTATAAPEASPRRMSRSSSA